MSVRAGIVQQMILRFLSASPDRRHSARMVSNGVGMDYSQTRRALARLAGNKRIAADGEGRNRVFWYGTHAERTGEVDPTPEEMARMEERAKRIVARLSGSMQDSRWILKEVKVLYNFQYGRFEFFCIAYFRELVQHLTLRTGISNEMLLDTDIINDSISEFLEQDWRKVLSDPVKYGIQNNG